jgi:hypothetical protein
VLGTKRAQRLALEACIDLTKSDENTVEPNVGKPCTSDYAIKDSTACISLSHLVHFLLGLFSAFFVIMRIELTTCAQELYH